MVYKNKGNIIYQKGFMDVPQLILNSAEERSLYDTKEPLYGDSGSKVPPVKGTFLKKSTMTEDEFISKAISIINEANSRAGELNELLEKRYIKLQETGARIDRTLEGLRKYTEACERGECEIDVFAYATYDEFVEKVCEHMNKFLEDGDYKTKH